MGGVKSPPPLFCCTGPLRDSLVPCLCGFLALPWKKQNQTRRSEGVWVRKQRVRPNLVPCFNLVLFASTTVCCTGRSATRYRVARETLPRVPAAFQGSNCVRGGLKRREYQVKARYQVRANPLQEREKGEAGAASWPCPGRGTTQDETIRGRLRGQ